MLRYGDFTILRLPLCIPLRYVDVTLFGVVEFTTIRYIYRFVVGATALRFCWVLLRYRYVTALLHVAPFTIGGTLRGTLGTLRYTTHVTVAGNLLFCSTLLMPGGDVLFVLGVVACCAPRLLLFHRILRFLHCVTLRPARVRMPAFVLIWSRAVPFPVTHVTRRSVLRYWNSPRCSRCVTVDDRCVRCYVTCRYVLVVVVHARYVAIVALPTCCSISLRLHWTFTRLRYR